MVYAVAFQETFPDGAPFTGELDTDEEGNVVEPYILGHQDGNCYHKWASI